MNYSSTNYSQYDFEGENWTLSNREVKNILEDHGIDCQIMNNDKGGKSVIVFSPGFPLEQAHNTSHKLFAWLGY